MMVSADTRGFSFSKGKITFCFRFANWILENAGKGMTARSGSTRQFLNEDKIQGIWSPQVARIFSHIGMNEHIQYDVQG